MVFHRGRRKCFDNTELFIDNIKIKQTETMKYLGVIIDTKLNWINHIPHAVLFGKLEHYGIIGVLRGGQGGLGPPPLKLVKV